MRRRSRCGDMMQAMWGEPLTPLSGAVLVALLSVPLTPLWVRVRWRPLAGVLTLVCPFAIANAIYWYPVWHGADSSEFWAWAPLFIGPWYVPATVASSMIFLRMRRRRDDAQR